MKRVPKSRLIEVHFEAEDPQLAAQVVNAHLQNYVEENFRSKYDATTQASNWLSAELEELRIKVEKSEDARIAYERENQIWQIDEKQDITTQKLADLSKAVTDAQTDVAEKEALYRMAVSGNVDALPAARNNDVISNLLKRKSELDEHTPKPSTSTVRTIRRFCACRRSKRKWTKISPARGRPWWKASKRNSPPRAAMWNCCRKRWISKRPKPMIWPRSSCNITFCSTMRNRISSSTTGCCKS